MPRFVPTRLPLFLSLALVAPACTKKEEKVEEKPALEAPEAPGEIEPEKPIVRDYPETTIVAASVVAPGKLLDSLVEQASPGYKWREKVDGIDPVILKTIDLDAPMDFLIGYVPKTPEGQRIAMGFGVKDPAGYEAALKAMRLNPTNTDGTISFTEAKLTCELPKGSQRVHCWEGDRARNAEYLAAIDAYKAPAGAPRMEMMLDADYLTGPLKPDVDGVAAMARVFGPQSLEQVKDEQLKADAMTMINESVDGTVALMEDFDRLEITTGLLSDNKGVYSRARFRFESRKSTLAKILSPDYLQNGPAPAAMMKLPTDINSATYALISNKERPEEVSKIIELVRSATLGLAREFGIYDPSLDTMLELMLARHDTPYTLQVQPRTPPPKVDNVEELGAMQGAPVIVIQPHGGKSLLPMYEALVAYLQSPGLQNAMKPFMAQLGDDALKISKAPELGDKGRSIHLKIDGEVARQAMGTMQAIDFELLFAEDDTNTYWGFGGYGDIQRDYIKRTMAGQGPTLADDPRAAYLANEKAFSATFTPVDPTYIAEFVEQLFGFMDPSQSADSAKFHDALQKTSEEWKKLPASAIQSRMSADKDGLVWETSMPPAVMRMMGDALQAGIEVFGEQSAAGGAAQAPAALPPN